MLVEPDVEAPGAWASRLSTIDSFLRLAQTPWVRKEAAKIVASTSVFPLRSAQMNARMIVCLLTTEAP
ncbi:MAG: hypothetical protein JST16_04625 [Bdellovibrionales bacterium]|nr:hypothetical protein [Bdellovibrionales bacterium]